MIELNQLLHYPRIMLKRLSYFAAYVLLVLMPMQALATANMLVCNSMMQSTKNHFDVDNPQQLMDQSLAAMPCHQYMTTKNAQQSKSTSSCQSTCASLCANLRALTAMPVQIQSNFAINVTQTFDFNYQAYASVIQPNLQRPPILLS